MMATLASLAVIMVFGATAPEAVVPDIDPDNDRTSCLSVKGDTGSGIVIANSCQEPLIFKWCQDAPEPHPASCQSGKYRTERSAGAGEGLLPGTHSGFPIRFAACKDPWTPDDIELEANGLSFVCVW